MKDDIREFGFVTVGVNYKKADESIRGKFSLSLEKRQLLLQESKDLGIPLLLICTCNRTELYSSKGNATILERLLLKYTNQNSDVVSKYLYQLNDEKSIEKLLRLGAGLESQILGDFEIIGQIKSSFVESKQYGLVDATLERWTNLTIETSKNVKNNTSLCSHAASTSYAAVQWIKSVTSSADNLEIVLFGTGEIGKITCVNLVKHFKSHNITLINRTKEKAEKLAEKFNVSIGDIDNLDHHISKANVLIVATNSDSITVKSDLIRSNKNLTVVDLSIPNNVEIKEDINDQVIALDELSKIADEGLEKRKCEIPKVETIVANSLSSFKIWMKDREHADVINAFKNKLLSFKEDEINYQSRKIIDFNSEQAHLISERIIQKMTKQFVTYLKGSKTDSTNSIAVMTEIFNLDHIHD